MLRIACLVFLGLAGGALSCTCTPRQWEGNQGVIGGYSDQKGGHSFGGNTRVSYDANNRKIAAFSDVYYDGKPFRSRALLDYEKGVMYVVYEKTCNVTRLEKEFKEACVPEGAKKLIDTHMGAGSDSLDVTGYLMDVDFPQGRGLATFTLTNDLCIPVGETVQGKFNGVGVLEVIGFTGIEGGIKDPSVFDVPEICRGREHKAMIAQPLEENVNGLDYMVHRITRKQSMFGF